MLSGPGALSFFKCCNAFLISLFEGDSVLMFKSVLAGGILGAIAGGGLFSSSSKYSLHLFSCSFSPKPCYTSKISIRYSKSVLFWMYVYVAPSCLWCGTNVYLQPPSKMLGRFLISLHPFPLIQSWSIPRDLHHTILSIIMFSNTSTLIWRGGGAINT